MEKKLVMLKRDVRTKIGNYFWAKGSLVEAQKREGQWWAIEIPNKPVLVLIDDRDFREFKWIPVKKKKSK